MPKNRKPPLGIIPRKIHMEKRAIDILQALSRVLADGYPLNDTTDE